MDRLPMAGPSQRNERKAGMNLVLIAFLGGVLTIFRRVFAATKTVLGAGRRIRQGLGLTALAGVVAIALGLNTDVFASASYASASGAEQALLDGFHITGGAATVRASERGGVVLTADDGRLDYRSNLPVEGSFPSLRGAVGWLNSPPLSPEQLRGKVVLVDFWTYSCINCIRTIPYVRAWAEKYESQGLVVIGVHTPEFAFEKNVDNIKKALSHFQIGYPVAIDSGYGIWRAFQNNYWPAFYFIDVKGQVRYRQFGEGGYDKADKVIRELLAEAGNQVSASAPIAPTARGEEVAPDLGDISSGETYIGYREASHFASPEYLQRDVARTYATGRLGLNEWSLAGNWTVGPEQATLNQPGGDITYRFSARDLHLVLGSGPGGKPVRFQVSIDGKAPGEDHAADTDASGNGTVTETRLYQLVRQTGRVGQRTFDIRFLDPGVQAFVFTFG
jgi:thiol-disulfide isomerase/thioredoxin